MRGPACVLDAPRVSRASAMGAGGRLSAACRLQESRSQIGTCQPRPVLVVDINAAMAGGVTSEPRPAYIQYSRLLYCGAVVAVRDGERARVAAALVGVAKTVLVAAMRCDGTRLGMSWRPAASGCAYCMWSDFQARNQRRMLAKAAQSIVHRLPLVHDGSEKGG